MRSSELMYRLILDVNRLGKEATETVEVEEKDEVSSCCSKAPSLKEVWHTPPSKRKGSCSVKRRSLNESASSCMTYQSNQSELEEAVCDDNAPECSEQDILKLFTNDMEPTELDIIEVESKLQKFFKVGIIFYGLKINIFA